MTFDLNDVVSKLENSDGTDLECNVLIWLAYSYTEGGDEDAAWAQHLPMSADLSIGHWKSMHDAFENCSSDLGGLSRAWNIPDVTGSVDSLLKFIQHWFGNTVSYKIEKNMEGLSYVTCFQPYKYNPRRKYTESHVDPYRALLICILKMLDT